METATWTLAIVALLTLSGSLVQGILNATFTGGKVLSELRQIRISIQELAANQKAHDALFNEHDRRILRLEHRCDLKPPA